MSTRAESRVVTWLLAGALRRAGRRLGPVYAEELATTLRRRLLEAGRLSWWRRIGRYAREARALRRLHRGLPYHLGGGSRPDPGAPARARGVLAHEFRLALRQLRRAPGFTLGTTLILGLGIGASTAMFTLVDAVLLRPLPYPQPERLLRIANENPRNRFNGSVADLLGLRIAETGFEAIAGYTTSGSSWYRQTFTMTLTDEAEPRAVEGTWVSADYFEVLGVAPTLGRTFAAGEDRSEAAPTVVLSDAFWRSRFGGAADVIGRSLEINGIAHTVIGVMPADFRPLGNPNAVIWPAFRMLEPGRRGPFFLRMVGRLAPGTSAEQAVEALQVVQRNLQVHWNDSFNGADTRYVVVPVSEDVVGDIGATLWPLLGAVAMLLAIALANVANLVLARTVQRDREFAMRVALGAGWTRLLTQLLCEGTGLAGIGALVGIGVGRGLLLLVLGLAPEQLPRQAEIGLDARALGVALALGALAAMCFGLISARQAIGRRLAPSLSSANRSLSAGVAAMRFRRVLVVAELALAVPLLVGALVLMLSLGMLQRVDPGFEPTGVLSMRISLPVERFESVPALFPAYNALIEQVGAVGGVESAALGSSLPPSRLAVRNNFVIRGRDNQAGGDEVTHYVSVGPEFFSTLGIPLLRGRNIAAADNADAPFVAIVDSAFEARYLNAAPALGTELQFGGCRECPWARVVGVVGPVHYTGPGSPAEPTIYVPIAQEPQTNFYLAVRADPRAGALIPALRRAVGVAVPGVAPTQVHTMRTLLSDAVAAPRYRSLLLGWFALVAIVLAAVGVYAVMASFVSQQRRELGVRMALGASRVSVVGFVLGRAAALLGLGVTLGIGLSVAAGRMLRQLAHGIDPGSAWLAAAAALLLALVALVSTLVPALRASRLDPVTVLRIE